MSLISQALLEIARAAATHARRKRFTFTAMQKPNPVGGLDNVTDVDQETEAFIIDAWIRRFPHIPIIGEETSSGQAEVTGGEYLTIDPIDGTDALLRKQSHGLSTMLAYVKDGKVAAACIVDILTGDAYLYGDDTVALRSDCAGDMNIPLAIDESRTLASQHLMCGLHPDEYSPLGQALTKQAKRGGLFRDLEIDKGSIGCRAARLWKGEVAGLLMKPRYGTPWDDTPVVGFFQRMGFVFIMFTADFGCHGVIIPSLMTKPTRLDYETLIIHRSRLTEFGAWLDRNR